MEKKTPFEIRDAAKGRAAEINLGKDPNWDPMDRENTHVYVGAFQEGYEQALKDLQNENSFPKAGGRK